MPVKISWKLVMLFGMLALAALFFGAVCVGTIVHFAFPELLSSNTAKVCGYIFAAVFLFVIGRYMIRPKVRPSAPNDVLVAAMFYVGLSASYRDGGIEAQALGFALDLLLFGVFFSALKYEPGSEAAGI